MTEWQADITVLVRLEMNNTYKNKAHNAGEIINTTLRYTSVTLSSAQIDI